MSIRDYVITINPVVLIRVRVTFVILQITNTTRFRLYAEISAYILGNNTKSHCDIVSVHRVGIRFKLQLVCEIFPSIGACLLHILQMFLTLFVPRTPFDGKAHGLLLETTF